MEILLDIGSTMLAQFQKPTLAFLLGGMMLAALGSKLQVPEPVYKFIVILLLLKVGLGAGISVRESDLVSLAVPALLAALTGIAIVLIGGRTLAKWPGVSKVDGLATAGLFGAVSASTLAAGMAMLEGEGIAYEGFIGALYPFMDIAALVTAIVLARIGAERHAATIVQRDGTAVIGKPDAKFSATFGAAFTKTMSGGTKAAGRSNACSVNQLNSRFDGEVVRDILADTFRSPAISALLLGLAIGFLGKPDSVFDSFYEPLFYGLLSVLMLIMGMEAWTRLFELRKVAYVYVLYGIAAPLLHGLLGFGAGLLAHHLTGFSAGGVVLLAVMASSSSDISGPPTLRGALPEANPSAYVGTSTGLGTPVAILSIPLFMALADAFIGF